MAKVAARNTAAVMLLAAVVATMHYSNAAEGGVAACAVNYKMLYYLCQDAVAVEGPAVPPTQDCCDEVARAGPECICLHMPNGAERLVSMQKVVGVFKYCGLAVPNGVTCGNNYSTPTEGAAMQQR